MKRIKSTTKYSGKLIKLYLEEYLTPDGESLQREIVRHPGAAAMVPVLGAGNKVRVLLVNQYRSPVGGKLWEIPAGTIEQNETPIGCARRELIEETGYQAESWDKVISFYTTPGFCDEIIHLFIVRKLSSHPEGKQEPDLQVREFPLTDLRKMIENGKIRDSKTIIGISMLDRF